jgi:Catalase
MATKGSRDARKQVSYGEEKLYRGAGGETHQSAGEERPKLTTQQGAVVSDDQNTLRVGDRGPAALEDFHFREKIFHFDHERIPERVVHARGYGAHGFFENYEQETLAEAVIITGLLDGQGTVNYRGRAYDGESARLCDRPAEPDDPARGGAATPMLLAYPPTELCGPSDGRWWSPAWWEVS